jgi:hypothetical protein
LTRAKVSGCFLERVAIGKTLADALYAVDWSFMEALLLTGQFGGPEAHPETLTSMANLAATYRDEGRWDEAEELEVQVMETSKVTDMTQLLRPSSVCWRERVLVS